MFECGRGLIDVAVVCQPPSRVASAQPVGRRPARQRGSVLIVEGAWPRAAVSMTTVANRWAGLGWGFGHLQSRELTVEIRTGSATYTVTWGMPTADEQTWSARRPATRVAAMAG